MNRVVLIVEGQTELVVVRDFIALELLTKDVIVTASLVGSPGHKGGVRSFQSVCGSIQKLLKHDPIGRVGTMFDYYALPSDWPGLKDSKAKTGLEKAGIVEAAMSEAVAAAMGPDFRRERFIPYIQLHELEALLFADPDCMARVFEQPQLAAHFTEIMAQFGNDSELIDEGRETAPSKRIQFVYPRYQKGKGMNSHAPMILMEIGIERVRKSCRHFDSWLKLLE